MSDELARRLRELDDQVRRLTERVWQLEQNLGATGDAPPPTLEPPPEQETPVAPGPEPEREPVAASPPPTTPTPPMPPQAATPPQTELPAAAASPVRGESLETKIGRYWLNRIGITALVLSVAFFILYNFPRLGPHMKIATGCAVSLVLLLGGMRIEREHTLRWYGRGLIGGAWALLYFTAYAMYHIPMVRIIDSPAVDLSFLLVIAAGAVTHAMRYRSQVITALAALLGFLTITISTVSGFTLVATAILVAGLVYIIIRMRWHAFCLYAVLLSYLTYAAQTNNSYGIAMSYLFGAGLEQETGFWLNAGFLTMFWAGYIAAVLGLDEDTREKRRTLVAAALANALLFTNLLMVHMGEGYAGQRSLALLGIGLVYAILMPVARRLRLPTVSTVHLVLALALPTLAIAVGLSDRWTVFLWTIEIPILVWVGFRLERLTYRAFAGWLAFVDFAWVYLLEMPGGAEIGLPGGLTFSWRLLIAVFAVGAFGLAAAFYRSGRYRPLFVHPERGGFYVYFLMASAVAWQLVVLEPPEYLQPLGHAALGFLVLLLGWKLADRWVRGLGALWFLSAVFSAFGMVAARAPGAHFTPLYGVAALALAAGFLYRWRRIPGTAFLQEPVVEYYYAIVATILLGVALAGQLPREWVWFAWATEGFLLLVLGIGIQDRIYRLIGRAVFAMAAVISIVLLAARGQMFLAGPNYAVAAIAFVASLLYRRGVPGESLENEWILLHVYAAAGATLLTLLLWRQIPGEWLSLAWAAEGFALVVMGFALSVRSYRILGLSVFGILVLKILFVDLAGADTTYRILSFLAVGVMMLLASFAYGRFSGQARR